MALYRVATNGADYSASVLCVGIDAAGEELRTVGFEPATVWRYDGRSRHWSIIFDTSMADASRLPPSLYWCNVAQNEKRAKQ